MYKQIYGLNGKLVGIIRTHDCASVPFDNPDFVAWNAEQKIDLSDKEPDSEPVDIERAAIMSLLDKNSIGTMTNAERQEFCFNVCKRMARGL